METFLQWFSPYARAPVERQDGDSKPEGKAAARRRKQMERQRAAMPAAPAPIQIDEPLILAVEQAQDECLARWVEAVLEPAPEPVKPRGVDQAIVTEWFMKWRKAVKSWLRNRAGVPVDEADDLVQEVFMRLLRYSSKEDVENPQGYLFRIAANVAHERRERSRVRQPHEADWLDELVQDSHDQPEAIHERECRDQAVEDAVNELRPRQRQLLLAHANDRLTYKQIAERYGLTYRIVLRDLTRAYAHLRMRLPEHAELRSSRLRKSSQYARLMEQINAKNIAEDVQEDGEIRGISDDFPEGDPSAGRGRRAKQKAVRVC